MTQTFRSSVLQDFEDTRPALHFAPQGAPAAGHHFYWSTATVAPAAPLPQDAWLIELPPLDPPRPERVVPLWLRIVGVVAAALLTLCALGLAANLLDAQDGGRGERLAVASNS